MRLELLRERNPREKRTYAFSIWCFFHRALPDWVLSDLILTLGLYLIYRLDRPAPSFLPPPLSLKKAAKIAYRKYEVSIKNSIQTQKSNIPTHRSLYHKVPKNFQVQRLHRCYTFIL